MNDDFDQTFPHLKESRVDVFVKRLSIENIPVAFQAKRRIQFDEIVNWLRQNTLPIFEKKAKELEAEFDDVDVKVSVSHQIDNPRLPGKYSYLIDLSCRRKDEPKIESGNTVSLYVSAQQYYVTSYPTINACVAWAVDEESGGEFGDHIVARGTLPDAEIHAGTLEGINRSLIYSLEKDIKREVAKLHTPSKN